MDVNVCVAYRYILYSGIHTNTPTPFKLPKFIPVYSPMGQKWLHLMENSKNYNFGAWTLKLKLNK